jgi:2-polyprenyl-6-methoxyphenol hydroxylase-like FAD-dependent oxidoreductase
VRVLIVGGGIAGLALARALQERGIAGEIVERKYEWPSSGAGLYLPGNAVRALDVLGIGAEVAARGHPIERQRFLDHRGRLLAEIEVEGFWDGVGGCVAIPRAALHEALREGTTALVRLGTALTGLENADAPRVSFSDGSSRTYDLVVGADGIHSTVRRLAFGRRPARYVGQASWRFVAEGFPEITDWTVMLARGRAFLTVALGQGAVYCYADVTTSDPVGAGEADWRESFVDFADPVPRLLHQGADPYFTPIEEVVPPAWSARRVVLVGDAAHASSPNMAQGAAMAIEDALVLAAELTAGQSVEDALAEYERRRAGRVQWVQKQTHRRDRTRNLLPTLRDLLLRLAGERIFRSNYAPLRESP